MAENMMNQAHKATNEAYREGYDLIFGKKEQLGPQEPAGEQDGD